ncbi:hypothetical protein AB4Z45_20760 [Paenibacillus sp. MCAF9]|uniref:hypothetical protein n=1 Tax=unclassified Paenibacillus TaxID=185978 RepID=UPI003F9D4AD2
MKEQLFKYYKNEGSNYALVFSYMKKFYNFYIIFLIFFLLISLSTVVSVLFIKISLLWIIWSLFIISLLISTILLLHKTLNSKARRIIKQEHSITPDLKDWQSTTFEIQVHLISEYLIEHDLYYRWKIEKLIEAYKLENEKGKLPPLIAPGIILAVSIPNLTQLLSRIYDYEFFSVPSPYIEIVIFLTVLVLSMAIVATITMLSRMKDDLTEMIVNKDRYRRVHLINILDDVMIQMRE